MSLSSNAMFASPHRDVLDANPDSDEAKARLVEEIKNRGRSAVTSKAWMDAALLYEKAISLQPNEATLQANLSLVKFSMGEFEDARAAAQTAVDLDVKYVKGYWRLGQALTKLGKNEEALKVNQKALVYEPTNKAVKKEIEKLKKVVEEEKERKQQEDAAMQTEVVESTQSRQSVEPASKEVKKPSSTGGESMQIDDEVDFTKSDHVKGYKVVNGKKTSYFHNELTDEAKKLIGDIAPKRIEVAAPAPQESSTTGSAWNKAGTWEERDVTSWATDSLQQALDKVVYILPDSSPAPGAVVTISKVSKCDGHASYATVRGKKRYIYEFAIKVDWEFVIEDDRANGHMDFPDFDGTCELGEGYDMTGWQVSTSTSANLTPLLDRFVKNGGLRDSIHEALDNWVREFRKTY